MHLHFSRRSIAAAVMTILSTGGFALTGSGDSAPGTVDTLAPTPGFPVLSPTGAVTGINITYLNASDTSGIARVELWARPDSGSWGFSAFATTPSGSMSFVPAGTGLYHFALVAEDTVGNRSAAPSGATGTGQGSVQFVTSAPDWSVLGE